MEITMPYDFGKLTVDQCQRIDIAELLVEYRTQLKEAVLAIEVMGLPLQLTTTRTPFNGTRYWFACPGCGRRTRIVYQHPFSQAVGCRACLNLDYRTHRYKGMIEEGKQSATALTLIPNQDAS